MCFKYREATSTLTRLVKVSYLQQLDTIAYELGDTVVLVFIRLLLNVTL